MVIAGSGERGEPVGTIGVSADPRTQIPPTAVGPESDVDAPKPSRKDRRAQKRAAQGKSPRRGPGYWLARGLRKAWMPLVILAVVGVGAFAVDRLHGVFGKTELTRPGSGLADDPEPFNPKTVVYEIFGPEGAVATVNYLDLEAEPQIARDVTLPWTLTLTTTAPAAAAT
ncbi:MAG: MmpS family transport accessory protein, partial [Mycobacterium sp.]